MARLTLGSFAAAALALSPALADPIEVKGKNFALHGDNISYRFHVDETSGDLVSDHFGGSAPEDGIFAGVEPVNGWGYEMNRLRREYPDVGRGDFRTPAIQIRQTEGHTVSDLQYKSHDVMKGKPELPGLPALFGEDGDVSTLVVHMYDNYSSIAADLSYSIFPKYDAIVRSVNITNKGHGDITIEKLASLSVDLPHTELDMLELNGDWAREGMRERRHVGIGTQGFHSAAGYSSHMTNPFLSLVDPDTTESQGEAYGFSLIYTGSFSVNVEKGSQGLTRATLGFNPLQFQWTLKAGETFTTPECVAIYSDSGIGDMSRKYHRLYRRHLMKSKFAEETRPSLLNSWEGLGPDINSSSMYKLAQESAELGVKMLVMDDGWFGNKFPRVPNADALGDWQTNKERFPNGLPALVDKITNLRSGNSSDKLKFGIWFEPEMVSPNSSLYEKHPDWALHAGHYPRSLIRNQLVLNMGLPEVQDFVIDAVSKILKSADITYVKWDNNRGIQETPSPETDHKYMLGAYRVFEILTSRFPDVLWEGCASGGGRFDPGILQWFPQIWASDDTDAVERISIQFGTSLAYPPSAMGAHVSHVPNGVTERTTPVHFRAHVAMMAGSFGLELNPTDLDDDERAELPSLISLAEKINPIVVKGDFYRLALPEDTTHPAAQFISEDGSEAVLFAFQTRAVINNAWPWFRMQGLDASAKYKIDNNQTLSGATLMNAGIQLIFEGDYDSKVMVLEKQ